MSRARAVFRFPDGTDLHGEYEGTGDWMQPQMFITAEEAYANWRQQDDEATCTCGQDAEPCLAYSDYGDGFEWDATACRTCMVFLGPSFDGWVGPLNEEVCISRDDMRPKYLDAVRGTMSVEEFHQSKRG